MKKKYRPLNLLPFYFRNIGLGLLGFLFVSVLVKLTGWSDFEFLPHYKQLFEIVFLVSLLIIAVSKGRIEDELTLQTRTRIWAMSFIYGVALLVVKKIFNLWGSGANEELSAFELAVVMLFFYFVMFWIVKREDK